MEPLWGRDPQVENHCCISKPKGKLINSDRVPVHSRQLSPLLTSSMSLRAFWNHVPGRSPFHSQASQTVFSDFAEP